MLKFTNNNMFTCTAPYSHDAPLCIPISEQSLHLTHFIHFRKHFHKLTREVGTGTLLVHCNCGRGKKSPHCCYAKLWPFRVTYVYGINFCWPWVRVATVPGHSAAADPYPSTVVVVVVVVVVVQSVQTIGMAAVTWGRPG